MIRHMRHGSPPRLMALQSILSPNRRESLPTPSAGVRITPPLWHADAVGGVHTITPLQAQMVSAQVAVVGERRRGCIACGRPLASKGHYRATFRSLFGDVPAILNLV